jgi:hypothetical protein
MEAASSSGILIPIYKTTWHHIPEDSNLLAYLIFLRPEPRISLLGKNTNLHAIRPICHYHFSHACLNFLSYTPIN